MKTCTHCLMTKEFAAFTPRVDRPGKFRSRCKECSNRLRRKPPHPKPTWPATKVCTRCGQERSRSEFYRHARSADGLKYQCKTCASKHQMARMTRMTPQERCWRNQASYWSRHFEAAEVPPRGVSDQRQQLIALLSHTQEEFIAHMESQFAAGMSWENYGSYWEIDHITPRSHFHAREDLPVAFLECHRLSNLQPLTKEENQRKFNKMPEGY